MYFKFLKYKLLYIILLQTTSYFFLWNTNGRILKNIEICILNTYLLKYCPYLQTAYRTSLKLLFFRLFPSSLSPFFVLPLFIYKADTYAQIFLSSQKLFNLAQMCLRVNPGQENLYYVCNHTTFEFFLNIQFVRIRAVATLRSCPRF